MTHVSHITDFVVVVKGLIFPVEETSSRFEGQRWRKLHAIFSTAAPQNGSLSPLLEKSASSYSLDSTLFSWHDR
jgi:hypothetical protein